MILRPQQWPFLKQRIIDQDPIKEPPDKLFFLKNETLGSTLALSEFQSKVNVRNLIVSEFGLSNTYCYLDIF